jgi:hypothetical protein
MTYPEVITALVALLGVLISLVSLKRTREFNKRQLDMQEETTRLSKIQREILEREEARRQAAEQQLADNKRDTVAQELETARLNAVRRAQGDVFAHTSLNFGIPSIILRNSGYVPVREVSLLVTVHRGPASPLLESYLSAVLPVKVIAPGEEVSIAVGTKEDSYPQLEHLFLLKWLSPNGELLQKEGKLPLH